MNQKTKDDLFMARGLGNEPYQKDGRVLIRTNAPYYKTATYRLLVNASGNKTPAGEYYEDEFGQNLLTDGVKGQTFNDKQAVTKRGASEYIVLRNGKEVVVRTWKGTKYTYTAIGKRYFAKQKKEYVIEIPVNIIGYRSASEAGRSRTRDGTYTRKAYMPVHAFPASRQSSQTPAISKAQLEKTDQGSGDAEASVRSQCTWRVHFA